MPPPTPTGPAALLPLNTHPRLQRRHHRPGAAGHMAQQLWRLGEPLNHWLSPALCSSGSGGTGSAHALLACLPALQAHAAGGARSRRRGCSRAAACAPCVFRELRLGRVAGKAWQCKPNHRPSNLQQSHLGLDQPRPARSLPSSGRRVPGHGAGRLPGGDLAKGQGVARQRQPAGEVSRGCCCCVLWG